MKKFDFSVMGWRFLLKIARHKSQDRSSVLDLSVVTSAVPERADMLVVPTLVPALSEPQPVAEEIVGWRSWILVEHDEDLYLRSFYHDVLWQSPVMRADAKPTKENAHGIYMLRKRVVNKAPFNGYFITFGPDFRDVTEFSVEGTIALSGIVIEGEDGFRGEQAVIRSLKLGRNLPPNRSPMEVVERLEARYGVDVEFADVAMVMT